MVQIKIPAPGASDPGVRVVAAAGGGADRAPRLLRRERATVGCRAATGGDTNVVAAGGTALADIAV